MNRATPEMRALAKQLIACEALDACEALENKSTAGKIPPDLDVGAKLRPHLATLMLALSHGEIPWLRAVRVNADGSLEGMEAIQGQLDPTKLIEGLVVLLAQLLGLLLALIGPSLTARLGREIWPQTSSKIWTSAMEEKNEKTH